MIEKWFEPFILVERVSSPDGMGGECVTWQELLSFQGVMTFTPEDEITAAGQRMAAAQTVLLHEFDITLSPGDHVRRVKDGALFRIAGRADSMRAPAFSGLHFAQVTAERVVTPC